MDADDGKTMAGGTRTYPESPGSAHERERKQGGLTTNNTGSKLEMAKGAQGITEMLIYPFR